MIGDRLGKWVIEKEIGRGGMGHVYLAREEPTGRPAALKVLSAELAQEPGFLIRFQREIEALSKLTHPNIVAFYESGFENGRYFYAMEYADGPSLDTVLLERGRVPWPEVLDIAQQIVPALRHVHDHGIIHRDLKPSNLLRTADGTIKLTDFGIAKVFASRHLTATGGIVGTAEFLSPEQAAGKVVGKRSDLYCLGAVLYSLLTGRPPFQGAGYLDLLHKHRYAQCDRPRRFIPDLPPEIDELVCQLLEKDPDKRPRDCILLGRQLAAIRQRLERRNSPTQVDSSEDATRTDHRLDPAHGDKLPGPATLMSGLMRDEVRRQKEGNALQRFFNRGWVLATLLALCVGVIVWTFWPAGERSLFEHGAALMETGQLVEMEHAWTDYFEPLNRRFPNHPYAAELERYRQQLEAARSPEPSEAQRFYRQGEALLRQGDVRAAGRTWRNLVAVFQDVDAERDWVGRAEQALLRLEKADARDRLTQVRPALDRAARLQAEGRRDEANRIWTALEELYRDDPAGRAILDEIGKQRR
jgi:serine/threonine-protein kinase